MFVLGKAMKRELKNGWGIILHEDDAGSIPGFAPMGVAEPLGINAFGEYIPKKRVTHELCFPGIKSKKSLNSRVKKLNLNQLCSVTA